jgi:hypothetical protein
MGLWIAGRIVDDPMSIWRDYARRYPRTIAEYDLGGHGYPDTITVEEARRTRIMNSRISDSECEELVARAAEPTCPWRNVSRHAELAHANPSVSGGLFDQAAQLYWYFTSRRIVGVRVAKVHKTLHIKRPDMYPILDDRLRNLYRERAALWVKKLDVLDVTIDDSPPYWAAIRQDLLGNEAELDDYQRHLASADGSVRQMAELSKLRLLDIAAWTIATGSSTGSC